MNLNEKKRAILSKLDVEKEMEEVFGVKFAGAVSPTGWRAVHHPFRKDARASCGVYLLDDGKYEKGMLVIHNEGMKTKKMCFWDLAIELLPESDGRFWTVFNHYQEKVGIKSGDSGGTQRKLVATYDYVDEDGKLLYQSCRYEPKNFLQRRPDGNGAWIWNLKGVRLVPYNLPAVLKADTVFVVEGEKDVETLSRLGLVGTCNPMGAGKWRSDFVEYFLTKNVSILADNDDEGRRHAAMVANSLNFVSVDSIGKWLKVVELPDLPEKGDLTDYINSGHTKEDLLEAVEKAPFWQPDFDETEASKADSSSKKSHEEPEQKIFIIDLSEVAEGDYHDEPLIEGLLGEKESLLICGPSGLGKSLLTLDVALAIANPPERGLWRLFRVPNPTRSVIIQSENGISATHRRLNKIFAADPQLKVGASQVFIPKIGNDCRMSGDIAEKGFQCQLIEILEAVEAKAFFLDPLVSYHGANENDNAEMRRSLDCLTGICDKTGASCIVIHHIGKNFSKDGGVFSGRGASAIGDWAANILLLERCPDSLNVIKATHEKSRNYEKRPPFYLQLTSDLILMRVNDPTKNRERLDAVTECLAELGGTVAKKTVLEKALAQKLGVSRSTAQRSINEALKRNLIYYAFMEDNKEGYAVRK